MSHSNQVVPKNFNVMFPKMNMKLIVLLKDLHIFTSSKTSIHVDTFFHYLIKDCRQTVDGCQFLTILKQLKILNNSSVKDDILTQRFIKKKWKACASKQQKIKLTKRNTAVTDSFQKFRERIAKIEVNRLKNIDKPNFFTGFTYDPQTFKITIDFDQLNHYKTVMKVSCRPMITTEVVADIPLTEVVADIQLTEEEKADIILRRAQANPPSSISIRTPRAGRSLPSLTIPRAMMEETI